MLGGITLHLEIFKIPTALVFIAIFLIAYHLKLLSFYFFNKLPKSQTRYNLNIKKKFQFLKKRKNFFTVYSLFNFSLFLSAPYVSGYLLNIRGLSYISYMYVMGAMFAGKMRALSGTGAKSACQFAAVVARLPLPPPSQTKGASVTSVTDLP